MAKSKQELAQDYTDIKTQAGLKLVRQIPGNYVGATRRIEGEKNSQALLQILQEVLSNSVDEARSGFGKLIDITIHPDNSVSVTDQGRGIPMGKNFDKVRRSLTVLGSSGKYDSNAYANSAGLHGEGVKACNALSDYIDVWSRRLDGIAYHVKYHMEEPLVEEVLPTDKNKPSGTKVTFLPDQTVFDTIDWDDASVIHRIEQTIYLTPGVKFVFTDERREADDLSLGHDHYHREWLSQNGLADYVAHVAESANLISGLSKPIAFAGEDSIETTLQATGGNEYGQKFAAEFGVQGALLYTENSGEVVASFVNGVPTVDGGTHETGAKSAVFQAIRDYALKQTWYKKSQTIEASDTRDGLILMISVSIPHEVLSFDSQTKTKLSTPEARTAVFNVIYDQLIKYLSDHEAIGKSIVEAILDSRKARLASKNERKTARALRKNKRRGHYSEKVKPASSRDPQKKSLFITEGDSASALLNMVRDKRYQGVLPIRGKILNVWKANSSKALANKEITDITQVLGAGFGKNFDVNDLQYGKVILACFPADTKVMLLDGTNPTIKEMADSNQKEFDVYSSTEDGVMVPGKAHDVRKISSSKVLIKVTLDDGQVIRATPDHFFMKRNGVMTMAKDLSVGMSLMPLYLKHNDSFWNSNRLMFKNNQTGNYQLVHRHVYAVCHKDYDERSNHLPKGFQIHHINENYLDNRPSNLMLMSTKDHRYLHGSEFGRKYGHVNGINSYLVKSYNGSEKQKEMLKEKRDAGAYEHATWTYTYNKTEKHRQDVKKAWKDGRMKNVVNGLITYNKSEKHRCRIAEVNSDSNIQNQIRRDRILKSIKFMLLNHIPINMNNWTKFKKANTVPWDKVTDYFASFSELVAYVRANYEQISLDDYKAQFESKTSRYYADRDDIRKGLQYNHKIVKIEYETFEKPVDVYCMEVDKYHNFAITDNGTSGIFVKNCDSDNDGDHIASLLITLFYKCFPGLIEGGHLYRVIAPLYQAVMKTKNGHTKYVLAYSESEHDQFLKQIAALKQEGYAMVGHEQRWKGLGSMNSEQTRRYLADPRYRKLYQIKIDDDAASKEMINIWMGRSADLRKQQLAQANFDDIDID